MTAATDWGNVFENLDWASVIATVGAVTIAVITFLNQKSAEKTSKLESSHIEKLTKSLDDAREQLSEHLKVSSAMVNRLVGLLEEAVKRVLDSSQATSSVPVQRQRKK